MLEIETFCMVGAEMENSKPFKNDHYSSFSQKFKSSQDKRSSNISSEQKEHLSILFEKIFEFSPSKEWVLPPSTSLFQSEPFQIKEYE